MHAVGYSRFGAARDVLELREVETPQPKAGEVLVALQYSGVNPSDVKARAGARPGITEPPFPFVVPHSDGAGVIEAVGDDVDTARIGQRVWVWNGQWGRAFGTCASHICLPAAQTVPLPDKVSFEQGAQLGIPGLTAAHCVNLGGDLSGKTVLVQGAGGTVGYLTAQLARAKGARVIATARGPDIERLHRAGFDTVLDFSSEGLANQILEAAGGPMHHIIDPEFGQNAQANTAVIAENGTIAAYGSARNMTPELPFYPLMFKAVSLHMVLIYLLPKAPRDQAISLLHTTLKAGQLDCPVAQIFNLADAARAHELVESGARTGAVLISTRP